MPEIRTSKRLITDAGYPVADMSNQPRIYSTRNNTDFIILETKVTGDPYLFERHGRKVYLCSIIGPTGEIRWFVPGWKEFEALSESEQDAFRYFDLEMV
jgi:hypothetical protein